MATLAKWVSAKFLTEVRPVPHTIIFKILIFTAKGMTLLERHILAVKHIYVSHTVLQMMWFTQTDSPQAIWSLAYH